MTEELDRRLVAVMFTDMVGYTALLQADERLGVEKRERYVAALDRHHDAFGGTIVQRLGDGSMSMFPSSLAAVQAAVAIQRSSRAQDVPVRVGIHVGEVIVEPERLTGDAVNIAARIESFAVPGGVLLSDAVYDQIKNRRDLDVVAARTVPAQERRPAVRPLRGRGRRLVVPDRGRSRARASGREPAEQRCPNRATPLLGRGASWRRSPSSCADTASSRSPGPAAWGRRAS